MSQAASWFLLVMFIALCAVVSTVIARRSGSLPMTEMFSDSSDYMGEDTRPPPPNLDIQDPDAPSLSPSESPSVPLTPPGLGMDAIGNGYTDDDEEADIEASGDMDGDQTFDNGIEPFVGEEYEAF